MKLVFIFVIVFSFAFQAGAQSGAIPPETPPSDPGGSTTPPPAEPASGSTTAPAPTPVLAPATEPPIVRPKTTPTITTPIPTESSDTPTILTAVLAFTLGLLGFFGLKFKKNKKKGEEDKDDKKCLNLKKLMEEKLNELTDLESQLASLAKEETSKQIKNMVKDTRAENLSMFIESSKKEYERLKELYEKCIASFSKKGTVFIFHGTAGFPEENWFPWLKEKLEKKGYKVFVPQFPTPEGQSLLAWFEVLEKYGKHINGNTIFVGHSLGCMFLLRILEKIEYRVEGAFFVAGMVGIKPILNYTTDYSFGGFDFNWEKIRDKSENFVVFHSDNDPYVGLENGKVLAQKLGVELSFIPNAGHFNTKAGYNKFEELLKKFK